MTLFNHNDTAYRRWPCLIAVTSWSLCSNLATAAQADSFLQYSFCSLLSCLINCLLSLSLSLPPPPPLLLLLLLMGFVCCSFKDELFLVSLIWHFYVISFKVYVLLYFKLCGSSSSFIEFNLILPWFNLHVFSHAESSVVWTELNFVSDHLILLFFVSDLFSLLLLFYGLVTVLASFTLTNVPSFTLTSHLAQSYCK